MRNALLFLTVTTVAGLTPGLVFAQSVTTQQAAPVTRVAPTVPSNNAVDTIKTGAQAIHEQSTQDESTATPSTDEDDDAGTSSISNEDDSYDQNNSFDDQNQSANSTTIPSDNPDNNILTDNSSTDYDQDE